MMHWGNQQSRLPRVIREHIFVMNLLVFPRGADFSELHTSIAPTAIDGLPDLQGDRPSAKPASVPQEDLRRMRRHGQAAAQARKGARLATEAKQNCQRLVIIWLRVSLRVRSYAFDLAISEQRMNKSEWALIFQLKPQICNQGVTGSNPVAGTSKIKDLWQLPVPQKSACGTSAEPMP